MIWQPEVQIPWQVQHFVLMGMIIRDRRSTLGRQFALSLQIMLGVFRLFRGAVEPNDACSSLPLS